MKAVLFALCSAVAWGGNTAPLVKAGAAQTVPATTASKQVVLTWTASTSTDVAGYHIYRSLLPAGTLTRVTTVPSFYTTYIDRFLASGTYYYVATAVDINNNESNYSNQASAVLP
jgi:hypothetical protein